MNKMEMTNFVNKKSFVNEDFTWKTLMYSEDVYKMVDSKTEEFTLEFNVDFYKPIVDSFKYGFKLNNENLIKVEINFSCFQILLIGTEIELRYYNKDETFLKTVKQILECKFIDKEIIEQFNKI